MLGNDRIYAIESPSYGQIRAVYEGAGAAVEPLPIGHDGIESEALSTAQATVLHVTPFHSYPTGVTAPAAKRFEYLVWARKPEHYIVEDDFDSEFFMPGKPLDSLYSMDKEGRVIYLNTFSKSLSPGIRMGYMILPEELIPVYDRKMGKYSCSVPLLEQYALGEFIAKGYFEQHLNRMRRHPRND
jgi:GntR family transcriptional regulator/MocR family aminotransferase